MLRIKDDSWQFTYTRGQSMYHDNFKFNSLTSLLDYYAYMIIGFDDDSWEPELIETIQAVLPPGVTELKV